MAEVILITVLVVLLFFIFFVRPARSEQRRRRRDLNALRVGDRTATGQLLQASAGLDQCLDALRPHWRRHSSLFKCITRIIRSIDKE